MFTFENLDSETRLKMCEEIDRAIPLNIYNSTRFNEVGASNWIRLLKEAAMSHNEHWLAFQLDNINAFNLFEERTHSSGIYTTTHVPNTASKTLADGQFNRFYMLGVCLVAIEKGSIVEIYRAQSSNVARTNSGISLRIRL